MPLSASSRSCDHSSLMEPSLKRSSGPSRDPPGLAALPASHDTLEKVVMVFKKARLFIFVSLQFSPSKVVRSGTSIYLMLARAVRGLATLCVLCHDECDSCDG